MQKYLIFLDIDGTIINEKNGEITQGTIDAVSNVRKQGHEVYINTGRSRAELSDKVLELGVDGLVCGCGTYIECHGEVLLEKNFGVELSRQIMEDIRKCNLVAVLEGTKHIYTDIKVDNPQLEGLKKYFGNEVMARMRTFEAEDMNYTKCSMWKTDEEAFAHFAQKYEDLFTFIDRGTNFMEAVPRNYSKASGIQFLMEHRDVPLERTMAVGDSANDLPMLEFAGISVAMGNSDPSLFDKVTFVTKSVEEDGIKYAMEQYGLL